jgi:hypothetical protein
MPGKQTKKKTQTKTGKPAEIVIFQRPNGKKGQLVRDPQTRKAISAAELPDGELDKAKAEFDSAAPQLEQAKAPKTDAPATTEKRKTTTGEISGAVVGAIVVGVLSLGGIVAWAFTRKPKTAGTVTQLRAVS